MRSERGELRRVHRPLSPGARVLIESLADQSLEAIPEALGARVDRLVRRESNDFRLDLDRLDEAVPKGFTLLVFTNLHNASGAALDAPTVRGIADLALDRGFYVRVDEIFRELAFDHEPPTMAGLHEVSRGLR